MIIKLDKMSKELLERFYRTHATMMSMDVFVNKLLKHTLRKNRLCDFESVVWFGSSRMAKDLGVSGKVTIDVLKILLKRHKVGKKDVKVKFELHQTLVLIRDTKYEIIKELVSKYIKIKRGKSGGF